MARRGVLRGFLEAISMINQGEIGGQPLHPSATHHLTFDHKKIVTGYPYNLGTTVVRIKRGRGAEGDTHFAVEARS